MKFETEQGLWVGYHWEGCETFTEAGSVCLSMESLDNDRPLFLMNHPVSDWGSDRLYRVLFHPVQQRLMDEEGFDGLYYWDRKTKWRENRPLKGLKERGYRLFSMAKTEARTAESVLANPKESVVSIEDITSLYRTPVMEGRIGLIKRVHSATTVATRRAVAFGLGQEQAEKVTVGLTTDILKILDGDTLHPGYRVSERTVERVPDPDLYVGPDISGQLADYFDMINS